MLASGAERMCLSSVSTEPKSPCCTDMQEKVLNNRYGYEDEKILIVHGKEDDNSLFFIFVDKERKDTMPLGACIWCGKSVQ